VAKTDRAEAGRPKSVRHVFVVSPARSGSTLLRYLLDSHPDVVSPPELNLSALLQHLVQVWGHTHMVLSGGPTHADPDAVSIPVEVRRRARKPVDEIMASCARAAGASVYCDKSLTTIDHLATVSQCYPKAPLIFLYRYPLDMIASGLEASRWGFNAFGFVPYVTATPGNFVAGLANYWTDKVSKMLEFERNFNGPSARIYYELLCDDPVGTMNGLFEFLDVPADESVTERAFSGNHGRGPGDYKIDYTGSISVESIGRGSKLPEHLGAEQVSRINQLLGELDYPELGAAWRGDLGSLIGLSGSKQRAPDGAEIADSIVRLLSGPCRSPFNDAHRDVFPFELVIARVGQGDPGSVLIESETSAAVLNGQSADTETRPRVRCLGDILLKVAAGEVTFGNAVRDGEIRIEADGTEEDDSERKPHEVLAALAAVIRAHG
jgi:Sulfotransferase family